MLNASDVLEGRKRFRAVSGVYRNSRQDDLLWFAFREPSEWVHLDVAERVNGAMHVEVDGVRRALLIVDGAVAVETQQAGPAYRRLHAMVEHGIGWPGPPDAVEEVLWEGRQAVRCRWHEVGGEATFDLGAGLVVRTEWPGEIVEFTDLCLDDDVDFAVFDPPSRTLPSWRGGAAHIVRDPATGQCSATWTPISGPGRLLIRGPQDVSMDEALAWAAEQTDHADIPEDG